MPRLPRAKLRENYERYNKPSIQEPSQDASPPVKSEMDLLIDSVRSASDALQAMGGPMANTRAALQYLSERYNKPPELVMSKWLDNKVTQATNTLPSNVFIQNGKTWIYHNQHGWVEVQGD